VLDVEGAERARELLKHAGAQQRGSVCMRSTQQHARDEVVVIHKPSPPAACCAAVEPQYSLSTASVEA